ncbi:uncharacterized protein DS421_5g154960 [Arachis hypogaea]|nr:uncharacterized protein DS421_5g154960 [Arachis hypogaea]
MVSSSTPHLGQIDSIVFAKLLGFALPVEIALLEHERKHKQFDIQMPHHIFHFYSRPK